MAVRTEVDSIGMTPGPVCIVRSQDRRMTVARVEESLAHAGRKGGERIRPMRLRPESIWHRHRGPIYGSECSARLLPRGCRGGGRGRSRSSRGREVRHGGRVPAGQGTTRSERNRSGRPFTGKDAAGMTPNARRGPRDRRCPVGRRRRGGSKRRAPVAPWLPRAGRGAVPCARCRQGTEPEKSVRPVWHNFRKPRTMVDSARSGSSVG